MSVTFRGILDDDDWDWILDRNHLNLCADTTGIIAVDANGTRMAATVMDTWTETSVQVHFIIDNPMVLRHKFFEEVSKFVFDTSKRLIMYGLVPANNEKSLRVTAKIGFKELTRLKDAFKQGIDYVLLELRKEHCNFNAVEG